MENNNKAGITADDEIDLLELAKTAWEKRRIIISVSAFFFLLGIIIALLSPKEFTAGTTFVPQTSDQAKIGSSLGGLASLAGINLGGLTGSSEIAPSLYPKILSAADFRKDLIESKINVSGYDQPISYKMYYDSIYSPGILSYLTKYTIGLPGVLLGSTKGDSKESPNSFGHNLTSISQSEYRHFMRLENQINVQFNEKEGFVTLSFRMPEPIMAAQMAEYATELLQNEVIDFKIRNAKEQLKFTEGRYVEKKTEFEEKQNRLANFRDKNQNLSSALFLNQLEKLESEYNLAFNVYTELAKQLEQANIQVHMNTPVFSVIQPVTIPLEKSAPKRPLIVIIFGILGLIVAFGYVFGMEFFNGVKEQWESKK